MSADTPIVVSFGGGVQSTALAHMVLSDDPRIRPFGRPSLWLFADTGDEPRRVYAHVEEWGNRIADGGMEFAVVRRPGGSLSQQVLAGERPAMPPLYVRASDGRIGPLMRQCTGDFKVTPIRQELRRRAPRWAMWLGISRDEAHRTSTPNVRWLSHIYPLVDLNLRRADCLHMLAGAGIDAPRSACTFCPFHSDEEWRRVREDAEDWRAAVEFERALHARHGAGALGLREVPHIHRSGVPLADANIDTTQEGFGWGNECAGVCGV